MGRREFIELVAVGVMGASWTVGFVGRVGKCGLFWGFIADGSEVEGVDGERNSLGIFNCGSNSY